MEPIVLSHGRTGNTMPCEHRFTSSEVDAMISIPLRDLGAPAQRVESARQP
jgi:hypothetical protein